VSPEPENLAELRRREVTRAAIRYFLLVFCAVLILTSMVAYGVWNDRSQGAQKLALRTEYCQAIEALKRQNREDVAKDIKDFPRTLRLLKLKDTPEIRKVAREGWQRKLRQNRARKCPYGA